MTDLLAAIGGDIAAGLDPAVLARSVGMTLDPWQADLVRGKDRQVLVLCSRQSGKSLASAVVAAHTAIYRPGSLVLLVSPSQRQSIELLAKVKAFVNHHDRPKQESETKLTLTNGSRIISLPGGDQTIRGFSADVVIMDEAARIEDATWAAVRPMLAVTNGRLIALSTPFGRRGAFAEAWHDGGDDWRRIRVPASECPRITEEFLEREGRALGPWLFGQEYELRWTNASGTVFNEDAITDIFAPWEGSDA